MFSIMRTITIMFSIKVQLSLKRIVKKKTPYYKDTFNKCDECKKPILQYKNYFTNRKIKNTTDSTEYSEGN